MAPPDGIAGRDSSVIYPSILAFSGARTLLDLAALEALASNIGVDIGCCRTPLEFVLLAYGKLDPDQGNDITKVSCVYR